VVARYAIYFAPAPDSTLARLAAAWLGRDPQTGDTVAARPIVPGLTSDQLDALTASPRHYGFHGTLKAPFRLTEGYGENTLLDFAARLADITEAFSMPLQVGVIAGFLALVPAGDCPELIRLASRTVKHFEPMRAPLTDAERARRRPERLSERQVALLDAWGYPYVLDEFRFHMTLTDRIGAADRAVLLPVLEDHFADVVVAPLLCDAITVFRQDNNDQPFRVLTRFPFADV
jgi:putative phosphonate metabolism protein